MPATPAPHARKVRVIEKATGHIREVWPVDAREIVRLSPDLYEYAPAEDAPAAPSPVAPASESASFPQARLDARAALEQKSERELKLMARHAGLTPAKGRSALVEQLVPHVAGGAVSLEALPPLALDPVHFPNAIPAED